MVNKGVIWIVVIALVVIIGILGYVYYGTSGTSKTNDNLNANNNVNTVNEGVVLSGGNDSAPSGTQGFQGTTYNVRIKDFAFDEAVLNIKLGDKVVWVNDDGTAHTVTSDSGKELDSGSIGSGKDYSHTFTKVGAFPYHCAYHPGMKGKIVVK